MTFNIRKTTLKNNNYRNLLHTGPGHVCNLSYWESEEGVFQIQDQCEKFSKTLSHNKIMKGVYLSFSELSPLTNQSKPNKSKPTKAKTNQANKFHHGFNTYVLSDLCVKFKFSKLQWNFWKCLDCDWSKDFYKMNL